MPVLYGLRFAIVAVPLIGIGPAHAQTSDSDRIQQGVALIKLGCGTGTSSEKTEVRAGASGSLTLRRLPGAQASGDIVYSKNEAQGLIAALQKELGAGAVALSIKQIDCMKPYVDRIFDILFPAPIVNLVDVVIRSKNKFIDNRSFGPVDGSISTMELKIGGKPILKHDLDKPFGSHSIKLKEGTHTFEFIAEIYGSGSNSTILKDNCHGTFSISSTTTLQPRVKFERRGYDGVFTDCSLEPM